MNIRIHNQNAARPVRLLICAALACAITGVTTEVIVSSANHLEYGIGASGVTATPPKATPQTPGQAAAREQRDAMG
jgi:hypothetical protein